MTSSGTRLVEGSSFAAMCGFTTLSDVDSPELDVIVKQLQGRPKDKFGNELDGWAAHWSRRYEFPYVYLASRRSGNSAQAETRPKALESGSGATPLPIWLSQDGFDVTCVDLDEGLGNVWARCDAASEGRVKFRAGDMQALEFADGHFDLVYSVSALEHTNRPEMAVAEVIRVARPGGLIVLTMDIALQGPHGIGGKGFLEIQELLNRFARQFYPSRWATGDMLLTAARRGRSRDIGHLRRFARKMRDHADGSRRRDFAVWCFAGVRLP